MSNAAPDRAGSFGWVALVYAIACSVAWIVMSSFEGRPAPLALAAGMLASVAVTFLASVLARERLGLRSLVERARRRVVALHLVSVWTPLAIACVLVVFVWAARLTLELGGRAGPDSTTKTGVTRCSTSARRCRSGSRCCSRVAARAGGLRVPRLAAARARAPARGELGPLGLLACALGLFAAGLELAADEQRRALAAAKPGALMDVGLWAWCRHPNYLGEILFWVSLWLFGVAADPSALWWTALGPLAIVGLFLGASIPLIEERNAARRPGWAEYKARTPRLLPRAPRR